MRRSQAADGADTRVRAAPWRTAIDDHDRLLTIAALTAIAAGGALHLLGEARAGDAILAASVALLLVPLVADVARTVLVDRRLGVDVIALLAMAGALALGEYLAGAVIALMFSGGQALEAAASRRARRELTALVQRAPRIAHRRAGAAVEEVPVSALAVGDVVLVRTGDVVPVDGAVVSAEAVVDESTLTGESLPVTRRAGEQVLSGTANAGAPSSCAPVVPPPRAPTRRWCAWSRAPSARARHSSAWPTATRRCSCR
jgi:cation transport ATPase